MRPLNQKTELDYRLELLLKKQNKVFKLLNRILLKQQNLIDKARNKYKCGTIKWMDGSVCFWLYVVEMAKRDFIAYYNNPNKWDVKTPVGKIWVSAYAFLFRDDYFISLNVEACPHCIDYPEEPCKICKGRGYIRSEDEQKFSLQDILDICEEACKSRKINSSVLNPSAEKIREILANEIDDEWLKQKVNRI